MPSTNTCVPPAGPAGSDHSWLHVVNVACSGEAGAPARALLLPNPVVQRRLKAELVELQLRCDCDQDNFDPGLYEVSCGCARCCQLSCRRACQDVLMASQSVSQLVSQSVS